MRWIFITFVCFMWMGLMGNSAVWAHGHEAHDQAVPIEQAIPDQNLVQVEVPVKGEEGTPVRVQLFSPPSQFFPSTDFPVVEGTQLLDGTFMIHDGQVSFKYLFPIRGTYQLVIEGLDLKSTIKQSRTLKINENPEEIQNAVIFLSGLLVFGFICGYLLTTWRRKNDAAF